MTGSLITTATWMRNFVRSHPSYKFDSVVSEEINYDMIKAIDEIEAGTQKAPELLPSCYLGGDAVKEGDAFKACCGDLLNDSNTNTGAPSKIHIPAEAVVHGDVADITLAS
jgi:hypothetical protein